MTINDRIKELRIALHLTQIDFGDKVGISQGHLTSIESGRRNVTEKSIKVICLQFGVNEDWLRDGKGEMFFNSNVDKIKELADQYGLSPLQTELIKTILKFPDKERGSVVQFICDLADSVRNGNTTPIDDLLGNAEELNGENEGK